MPTKPNRAGEQQNYVPPGNGDASGEYGDNATGSNKHFTAFAKPKKESRIKELDKNKLKQIGKYVNYYDKNKADKFESLYGNTYIGKNPTKLKNSYCILRSNFSGIDTSSEEETIRCFKNST